MIDDGSAMRGGAVEDIRDVKLPREGAFIFSVSGHYLSEDGTLSWDFCGEQGGIAERLHFTMEHGVCKPHYLETLSDDANCDGEWSTGSHLTSAFKPVTASSQLSGLRSTLHVGVVLVAFLMMMAIALMFSKKSTQARTQHNQAQHSVTFQRLDTTEHI